eukprot:scaffold109263_cov15-Tisochrysis_lutea.AAC.2
MRIVRIAFCCGMLLAGKGEAASATFYCQANRSLNLAFKKEGKARIGTLCGKGNEEKSKERRGEERATLLYLPRWAAWLKQKMPVSKPVRSGEKERKEKLHRNANL